MKKAISILLAVIMICGTMTLGFTTAFAAEDDNSPVSESSGTTGDCTWTLDDNGVLTISGEGKTDSYRQGTAPWGTGIKELIVDEGVTQIGKSAFQDCTELTKVTLPDSLTQIGNVAFNNCTALQSITIPKNVTRLGTTAFYNCTNLLSVEFLSELRVISSKTFSYCTKLKNVILPDSLITINEEAFRGCTELSELKIPDSVNTIDKMAFIDCESLVSVNIPDNVTVINDSTFYGCKSLENIELPYGVTTIGNYAFNGCTSLTGITLPYSVTEIGTSAFDNSENLTIYGVKDSYAETYANNNSIPFVEIEGPVTNIEVLNGYSITIEEGKGGIFSNNYNPITDEYEECFYYYYDIPDPEILITYKDGSTKTAHLYDEIEGGYIEYFDNQIEDPWVVGEDNYLTVKLFNLEDKIPVVIIPNNIDSIEVNKPMEPLIENEGGYFTTNMNDEKYFYYTYSDNIKTAELKVNYKDGTSKIVNGAEIDGCFDNQDMNPFEPYKDNYITVFYLNKSVKMPVIIVPSQEFGDVNNDGAVDILDAIEIQKFAAEKITMTDEQKELADVNKDGFIDVLDAIEVQKFAAGKITEFKKVA